MSYDRTTVRLAIEIYSAYITIAFAEILCFKRNINCAADFSANAIQSPADRELLTDIQ